MIEFSATDAAAAMHAAGEAWHGRMREYAADLDQLREDADGWTVPELELYMVGLDQIKADCACCTDDRALQREIIAAELASR